MDNPDIWIWIWLGTALLLGAVEMLAAGSFFFVPFAAGAVLASLAAAFDVPVLAQWLIFLGVSGGSFFALRPLARRLDAVDPVQGIGARRLIGETAHVIEPIPADGHDLGMAKIGREEWRIESLDGRGIPAGTLVRVVEVRGTRAVVFPVELTGSDPDPDIQPDSDTT